MQAECADPGRHGTTGSPDGVPSVPLIVTTRTFRLWASTAYEVKPKSSAFFVVQHHAAKAELLSPANAFVRGVAAAGPIANARTSATVAGVELSRREPSARRQTEDARD